VSKTGIVESMLPLTPTSHEVEVGSDVFHESKVVNSYKM
jgi:hypothetical protein